MPRIKSSIYLTEQAKLSACGGSISNDRNQALGYASKIRRLRRQHHNLPVFFYSDFRRTLG
jgi:hypothetical protein